MPYLMTKGTNIVMDFRKYTDMQVRMTHHYHKRAHIWVIIGAGFMSWTLSHNITLIEKRLDKVEQNQSKSINSP